MGAHIGRDVIVEFALKNENTTPADGDYKVLGMMRDKSLNISWETADTTADNSPSLTKTALATFKNFEFSGGGVSYDDEVHNQEVLEAHVVNPTTTGNQPKAWFRITYPNGKKYVGPFMVSAWSNSSPYADSATWTITATSNGAVVMTPAPIVP